MQHIRSRVHLASSQSPLHSTISANDLKEGTQKRGLITTLCTVFYVLLTQFYHAISRLSFFRIRLASPEEILQKYQDIDTNFDERRMPREPTHQDSYTTVIAQKANRDMLEIAAEELYSFHVFPTYIAEIYGTHSQQKRLMQQGDLIFLDLQLIPYLVETYALVRIVKTYSKDNVRGFILQTTRVHDEVGQLHCRVQLLPSGQLTFTFEAESCFNPFFRFAPVKWISRNLQVFSHHRAVSSFSSRVRARVEQVPDQ